MQTFKDFPVGKTMALGPYVVTAEEIIAFAEEFDPQPFHLSEQGGKDTLAGGLIASGWHSCSILMRMLVDGFLHNSASQGAPGVDEVRWLKPVRAGDILTGTSTVLAARVSKSKPELGIFQLRHEIYNQRGEMVMWSENPGMMGIEPPERAGK